jgi:hypothetical protein
MGKILGVCFLLLVLVGNEILLGVDNVLLIWSVQDKSVVISKQYESPVGQSKTIIPKYN